MHSNNNDVRESFASHSIDEIMKECLESPMEEEEQEESHLIFSADRLKMSIDGFRMIFAH